MIQQKPIENFKEYSQFESLKDFNNNIEAFLFEHKKDFTRSELMAFKGLVRFCAKVYGVSNASINTILRAIKERYNGHGVSESTFHRMKRKCVKLGILTVKETVRKDGSQSSNLWIFNRFLKKDDSRSNGNDTPCNQRKQEDTAKNKQTKDEQLTPQKTSHHSFKTSNLNNKRNDVQLDYTYTSNRVPKEFRNLVNCFFDNYKMIEELWKIITIQTRCLTYYTLQDKVDLAVDTFKQLIRNLKNGRNIKNIFGYYWGIVNNFLDAEMYELMATLGETD